MTKRTNVQTMARAVEALQAGELVAFPTETVYGLGADAMNEAAVAKIFSAKGRPADHPLIVHIASFAQLKIWTREISATAQQLAAAFWPGPLTLILPRAPRVLPIVTGDQDTVGVRCPAHPVAQALLQACAERGITGLAAPSANRFGHVSPTTAAHVVDEFGERFMVLDGGACEVGIESTIVDVTGATPRILRPGMLTEAEISAVIGRSLGGADGEVPRVSGSLAAHYAPRTALELVPPQIFAERIAEVRNTGASVYALTRTLIAPAVEDRIQRQAMPQTPERYAQALYAALRAADRAGANIILVEAVPESPAWLAVADRLRRAAHGAGRPA